MDDALLDDLRAEQAALDAVLVPLADDGWATPTSAAGWTVADQVHHLTASERAALACLDGRANEIWGPSRRASSRARSRPPAPGQLLAAWRAARAEVLVTAARRDSGDLVTWGAGPMSVRSLVTSRLMETWAHGLDCRAALGVASVDTDRLRHVAHLGYRSLRYAFAIAGREPPDPLEELRLELLGPGGAPWRYGPATAPQRIEGAAGEWCRVAVNRLDPAATSLRAHGRLARAALEVAQAYLDA